ncbi:MAG: hypothetical protein R2849_09570 [Thermomicrobiales bacterium]
MSGRATVEHAAPDLVDDRVDFEAGILILELAVRFENAADEPVEILAVPVRVAIGVVISQDSAPIEALDAIRGPEGQRPSAVGRIEIRIDELGRRRNVVESRVNGQRPLPPLPLRSRGLPFEATLLIAASMNGSTSQASAAPTISSPNGSPAASCMYSGSVTGSGRAMSGSGCRHWWIQPASLRRPAGHNVSTLRSNAWIGRWLAGRRSWYRSSTAR